VPLRREIVAPHRETGYHSERTDTAPSKTERDDRRILREWRGGGGHWPVSQAEPTSWEKTEKKDGKKPAKKGKA